MGDNVVSNTVLLSASGTAILVCIIYFFHAHLLPHVNRSKGTMRERDDISLPSGMLPQWQVRSDPQLREILYNAPTLNYLDPRNSVTGSDLKRSRWSTNIQDLSDPTPIKSTPRSAKRHVRHFSLLDVPLTANRRLPAPSLYSQTSQQTQKTMRRRTLDLEGTRRRLTRPVSTIAITAGSTELSRTEHPTRPRSRSDSQLVTRKSLLVRSHGSFYGRDFAIHPRSPMSSVLSETTIHSILMPSDDSKDSSRSNLSYFACQSQPHSFMH